MTEPADILEWPALGRGPAARTVVGTEDLRTPGMIGPLQREVLEAQVRHADAARALSACRARLAESERAGRPDDEPGSDSGEVLMNAVHVAELAERNAATELDVATATLRRAGG